LDRLDLTDHTRRAGPWVRISLHRPGLLFCRHRDRIAYRMGDRARQRAKIGECFEPLGFADAALIKPIFENP
jgi:hypothetical protein